MPAPAPNGRSTPASPPLSPSLAQCPPEPAATRESTSPPRSEAHSPFDGLHTKNRRRWLRGKIPSRRRPRRTSARHERGTTKRLVFFQNTCGQTRVLG